MDFLKPDIELAIPFFMTAGFPTDQKVIANAQHCAFDAHGRAVEVFFMISYNGNRRAIAAALQVAVNMKRISHSLRLRKWSGHYGSRH